MPPDNWQDWPWDSFCFLQLSGEEALEEVGVVEREAAEVPDVVILNIGLQNPVHHLRQIHVDLGSDHLVHVFKSKNLAVLATFLCEQILFV